MTYMWHGVSPFYGMHAKLCDKADIHQNPDGDMFAIITCGNYASIKEKWGEGRLLFKDSDLQIGSQDILLSKIRRYLCSNCASTK